MKPGFGKKKQKKQKKKDKKGKGDGDDAMVDAAPTAAAPSPEPAMVDAPAILSAKDKQRQRMELKQALKVQVSQLKSKRNKLTKLAGNRTERRQLNTQLKGLVQEQLTAKKGSSKGKQPGAAAVLEDVMTE